MSTPIISPRPEFEEEEKSELHTWVSGDPLPDGTELAARVARVRELLAKGADVHERGEFGDTPLHVTGEIEIAQVLLDAGASLDSINNNGDTPLHAVGSSSPEMAEFFIYQGADAEALNKDGEVPLKSIMNYSNEFDVRGMSEAFRRGIVRRAARVLAESRAEKAGALDVWSQSARTRQRA